MKNRRKNYSLDFKLKVLELLEERGCSMSSLGRELEIIRMNKELADIKLEHEILKKAVNIFSRSSR